MYNNMVLVQLMAYSHHRSHVAGADSNFPMGLLAENKKEMICNHPLHVIVMQKSRVQIYVVSPGSLCLSQ